MTDSWLDRLKRYCRAEDPSEEDLQDLEEAYGSAVGYLAGAGVAEPPEDTKRHGLYVSCVKYLVLDEFDRRDATLSGTTVIENPIFVKKFLQLKHTVPPKQSEW